MGERRFWVVFDSNVFVQVLLSPKGPAAQCFQLARSGDIRFFVSEDIIDEFVEVMHSPEIAPLVPDLSTKQILGFVSEIRSIGGVRDVPEIGSVLTRDPDDQMVIDLAVGCDADLIVSWDKDLLDLMTGTDAESKQFRQQFRHLKIVTPMDLLNSIPNLELPLQP